MTTPAATTAKNSTDTWWHPTDYLRVIYKRRWVAIPAFLLIFTSGAVDTMRAVPIYEARTQLLIEPGNRRATSIDSVLEDRSYGYYDDGFYLTQYKIIQSRSLALRAAEALDKGRPERVPESTGYSFSLRGLISRAIASGASLVAANSRPAPAPVSADPADGIPETAAQAAKIGRIVGGLSVQPVRNSSLVDLTFRSPDPDFAARAVNEVANQYRMRNLETRYMDSKEANDFLSEQLKTQRAKVEESEAALLRFRETHNAAAVDDKQNIVVQKLTELSAQVTRAKIERVDKEAFYNQLLQVRTSGGSIDSAPQVLSNDYIQKLKVEIANLEERRSQMAAQYGPNWPAMKDLTTSIATARQRMQVELDSVVNAAKNEFLAAKGKEESLTSALNAQKGEAMGLDRKAVEYAALEREATGNRQLYENLMQRTKETGVSQQFRGSNIEIVDRADVPQSPVLPKASQDLTVAALGGLFLALTLVFGCEYFDSRIKSPEEIRAHLGIPFLGLEQRGHAAPGLEGRAPGLLGSHARDSHRRRVFIGRRGCPLHRRDEHRAVRGQNGDLEQSGRGPGPGGSTRGDRRCGYATSADPRRIRMASGSRLVERARGHRATIRRDSQDRHPEPGRDSGWPHPTQPRRAPGLDALQGTAG